MADGATATKAAKPAPKVAAVQEGGEAPPREVLVLRLKREEEEAARARRVEWGKDVVDHPNQRTSKKCCQFHKKRRFGESDSEDSGSGDWPESDDDGHKCSRHHCHCGGTRFA